MIVIFFTSVNAMKDKRIKKTKRVFMITPITDWTPVPKEKSAIKI